MAVNHFSDSNNGLVAANLNETRSESPSPLIDRNFRGDRNRQEDHEVRRKDITESEEESVDGE